MFAELVAAVQHLHANHIVHRDIKLESKSLTGLYIMLFIGEYAAALCSYIALR